MKLFQYWDTGDPPDDVAACIEGFRVMNPDMQHRLFSRDDAAWFIKKHCGPRELKAFEACAVPAMQADYFRIGALVAKGGVWVDADNVCISPLREVVEQSGAALALVASQRLLNTFLICRGPGNPYFRACLELSTRYIETRTPGSVYDITGPGALNAVRAAIGPLHDPDPHLALTWDPPLATYAAQIAKNSGVREALMAMTRRHLLWIYSWLGAAPLSYKDGPRHWLNWTGSIYEQPPELVM